MTLSIPILLLLYALHPMVLMAAGSHDGPLIARSDRNFPPYKFIDANGHV
jgi:hypothetical protein